LSASPRALHVSPQQERLRRLFQARGCCDSHAARPSDCRRGGAAGCAALEELTEEERVAPRSAWPLSYVTRSLLMCSAQPLLPPLPFNGSLCCSRSFFSRRPQHKHKHRLCPEWLAASVCTPSLHEYARGMPPTANPCIASSDADADTASASPLTQFPRLAARSSQLAACSVQRPKPSRHGSVCVTVTVIMAVGVCVRACAAPSPPHLPAQRAAARSSALPHRLTRQQTTQL
jgi:hypothetical protein